jgi:pyroglutamyl-peptidase
MRTVMLTGFGPYGNTEINPARLVADALDGAEIEGATVVSRIAPCLFFESVRAICSEIDALKPDMVVMLGEYGGRAMVTVERLAHNLNDAPRYGLADNAGVAPLDEPTVPGGPVAYYATVPIRAMVKAMRAAGVPADLSDTPGTLICNHLMYGVLHHIASNERPVTAGWIHLPHLPSTAALVENLGAPSMSVETATLGVREAIRTGLLHAEDVREPLRTTWQV